MTQTICLDANNLTYIYGENQDAEEGSRNGVGKSLLIQALVYVLYDNTISSIKKNNLINNINKKNMLVTLSFTANDASYRIERGRSPNVFKLYKDGVETSNETQGEGRETQKELEKIIGISFTMFQHIVTLNTETPAFLNLNASSQRSLVEELFGITILSEKAEILKEKIRESKDSIKEETFKINAIIENNEGITKSINTLKEKSIKWEKDKDNTVSGYKDALSQLQSIDIENEIVLHQVNADYLSNLSKYKTLTADLGEIKIRKTSLQTSIEKLKKDLTSAAASKCYTCGQHLHTVSQKSIEDDLKKDITKNEESLKEIEDAIEIMETEIASIVLSKPDATFYKSLEDAYAHRQNINEINTLLKAESDTTNPYMDQIILLKANNLKEVNYDALNNVTKRLEHEEFLYKLLTNKDSFIRKGIVEKNLPYLNSRLKYYLLKMALPHNVEFKNDLSVDIDMLGSNFDFAQLSRGQKNRVILSLCWSFRDVWESINKGMNILIIDEMIDSGFDISGVESTIQVLKELTRERKKDIYLISNKEELLSRFPDNLKVVMKNGFTSYERD